MLGFLLIILLLVLFALINKSDDLQGRLNQVLKLQPSSESHFTQGGWDTHGD